ncbi:Uncharacterised protein [Mycobacteroides abscessus subsp. abscessus]|nr:Uncharacterised protein [Mycobacteroides abscessus subsp. abscessus]
MLAIGELGMRMQVVPPGDEVVEDIACCGIEGGSDRRGGHIIECAREPGPAVPNSPVLSVFSCRIRRGVVL